MSQGQLALAAGATYRSRLPLWLKVSCTFLAIATFSAYLKYYSFPHSMMWFSSLALLLTCVALWLESPLLASMEAVSVLALELAYTVDFFARLTTGNHLNYLSYYFFKAEDSPFWVRAFSLFHIPLPFLLLWLLWRLGYDRRAPVAQMAVCWVLLPVCYFFTNPADNVNWVFGPIEKYRWEWMPPWGYLVALMIGFPLLIYVPSHFLFTKLFPKPSSRLDRS